MRKIYNYIMIAVFAFAAISCIDEIGNTDIPTAEAGDEVQFGLSLPDAKTRTVYGDVSGDAFPIYWVDGDKVQIFSPQASEGRNNAEYKVTLPSGVEKPNYAEDLVKTGSYGVQWGEGVHDFYSIYPSGQYEFAEDENGNIWAKGVEISSTQNISYLSTSLVHAMNNCLMYAYTPKVEMGQVANLNYKPLSTVLWFTLTADEQTNAQNPKGFQIFGITLTANSTSAIAGSFDINLTAEEAKGIKLDNLSGGNIIKTSITDKSSTNQQVAYTLPAGSTISFPIFLSPDAFDINGWQITIDTDQGSYTKTLAKKETKLAAGQIHKIVLPKLAPGEKDWDSSKWMTYIPRNVYLSEVSIPGTWNSLNTDCQSNTSIDDQYALGVRAFHLDTRWKASRNGNIGQIYNPTITDLSVCDGTTSYSVFGESGRVNGTAAKTFESCLSTIVQNVKDDEYMVLFCTFAQDSYSGSNCPKTWYQAISDICDNNNKVHDASDINANTVVGDVLGKVIVIINLDSSVSSNTLPNNSKCLFTYVPMNLPKDHYAETTSHIDNLYCSGSAAVQSGISMYTSHSQISTSGSSSVDCGDRGYSHPLTSRDALVNSIWDWSKNNYGKANYVHNTWIYLGLGGYISTASDGKGDGYDTIENRYAPMIYNRIAEMGKDNAPYYPVGIILMNNIHGKDYTTAVNNIETSLEYGFSDVCKTILMLNNKYRLQYDSTKPEDYIATDKPNEEVVPDEEVQ